MITYMARRIEPLGAALGSVAPRTSPRKSSQLRVSVGHDTVYHWIFSPGLQYAVINRKEKNQTEV
jgi:hypothetical protein